MNRSTMHHIIYISIFTIAAEVSTHKSDREHEGPQTCGGVLKGPVGVIQTPNFPHAFPVPIKCKWIIRQPHDMDNGTISIFFTQQFTTSGLTFTEYNYYDDAFYKLGERRALTITEENITRIKWLQVQSSVLVVELNLNRLEGTQLRALGLLSVFGFNMTYSVRGPADVPPSTSCSTIECRLLGHCYASQNFRSFFCSCFDGYSGADCGVGPLCQSSSNMCKNGGICRQMGPAAVSCICAPGYTGDLCEAQIQQPECGIEECSENCKDGLMCDCNPKDTDHNSARFDTRLRVIEQPSTNTSQEIIAELTNYLKASNITVEDDIELLNISSVDTNGARTAYVRIWTSRRAAGALRATLSRLSATRATTNALRLLPDTSHFEMQPALNLHMLAINQRPEVWEGSEFILTCMAYGSRNIVFTWYKDGVKVNFGSTTREIWTRTASEDALGRRMSVLGITAALQVDGGIWSCSADDAGRRRCRALTITILTPPTIRLIPSTLTVEKGKNVSITCLAGAGRALGRLGFSWAREKSLLPMQPNKHVWEDLYPAGSVLKLYNMQKSGEYRCQVSSAAGTNSAEVFVWVIGSDEEACESDTAAGVRWSRTAPGAHASCSCPLGYSGEITRYCEPKTGQHGVKWMPPIFSGCISNSLKHVNEQFMLLSYGFSWGNISEISKQYLSILRAIPIPGGAGVSPLHHATQMLQYLQSNVAQRADKLQSTLPLLTILDHLLSKPDAFLDEQKINEIQNAIVNTASMKSKLHVSLPSFSVQSESSVHLEMRGIPLDPSNKEWKVASVHVELAPTAENFTIVVVHYHNLESKLPSLRTFTDHKSGNELQYTVCSQHVEIYIKSVKMDYKLQNTATLVFEHSQNYSTDGSRLACGLRSAERPGAWSISECEVRVLDVSRATCRCRTPGTIALLTRSTNPRIESEEELRGVAVICLSVGGAMCVCACTLLLLSLVPAVTSRSDITHTLLGACVTAGHAAAMFSLSQHHEPKLSYQNALEWVVAGCWCVASAALCAHPLLLHADLAGTTQSRHSVGLLAGVCVLCCLSARLWGGAPLQAGSAASSIFASGIFLLTTLTLALAICARRTLGSATHKLPPDRKAYAERSFLYRRRIIHQTLLVLLTSSAMHIAGAAYAQPGDKQVVYILALSITALINGVTILVCYVIYDKHCVQMMRRVITLQDSSQWHDSPTGETSLRLYIKQSGEVECRGGIMLESNSPPVSSTARYWRAPPLERTRSNPDSRADIVRCVEYKPIIRAIRHITHTRAMCDLISTSVGETDCTGSGCMATVCLETNTLSKPVSVGPCRKPYMDLDIAKKTCSICIQSNPDISKITSPPVKSCLKKRSCGFVSSASLPSIDTIRDEGEQSDIDQINKEWNKAYDPPSDKVLNKISDDLDFLLNRTHSNSIPHHIQEDPT